MILMYHPEKTDGGKGLEIPLDDDGRAIRNARAPFIGGFLVGSMIAQGYTPEKAEALVNEFARHMIELHTDKRWWPNTVTEDIPF